MLLFQAIKDGVIEATINHHEGYMQSKVSALLPPLLLELILIFYHISFQASSGAF